MLCRKVTGIQNSGKECLEQMGTDELFVVSMLD